MAARRAVLLASPVLVSYVGPPGRTGRSVSAPRSSSLPASRATAAPLRLARAVHSPLGLRPTTRGRGLRSSAGRRAFATAPALLGRRLLGRREARRGPARPGGRSEGRDSRRRPFECFAAAAPLSVSCGTAQFSTTAAPRVGRASPESKLLASLRLPATVRPGAGLPVTLTYHHARPPVTDQRSRARVATECACGIRGQRPGPFRLGPGIPATASGIR